MCFHFSIYNDLKHFRLTHASIKIFHDGTMYCILQWSGSFVIICKYSINSQTLMFYKASLIFRMVHGWLFFLHPPKTFFKGLPNVLLRTVAKFVERDAHTTGDSCGVSVGACVTRAKSMFRHCVFRLSLFVIVFGVRF